MDKEKLVPNALLMSWKGQEQGEGLQDFRVLMASGTRVVNEKKTFCLLFLQRK